MDVLFDPFGTTDVLCFLWQLPRSLDTGCEVEIGFMIQARLEHAGWG